MDKLAVRLARGDETAFAELYDACADSLYQYLMFRLRCPEDAREVLQETFLRLVRARKSVAKVDDLRGYVFTIARNEALRLASRNGKRKETVGNEEWLLADDDLQRRDAKESIANSLARLDPTEAEVVELKIHAGLTFREIAEVTGLPQGTVATRYRTAIGRLRKWLAKEFP